MIIIDTNVASELMSPTPDKNVVNWVYGRYTHLYLTSATIAETLYGISLMPLGKRRSELAQTAHKVLFETISDTILPFDEKAAILYAQIASDNKKRGRGVDVFDLQIAAIALSNNATVATRNIRDFKDCGVELINPWEA